MFYCDNCGACCRNIGQSETYEELDRGDGVCKFLVGNSCSIYAERPVMCKVDAAFDLFFKDSYTQAQYYKDNHLSCLKFKLQEGLEIRDFMVKSGISLKDLELFLDKTIKSDTNISI